MRSRVEGDAQIDLHDHLVLSRFLPRLNFTGNAQRHFGAGTTIGVLPYAKQHTCRGCECCLLIVQPNGHGKNQRPETTFLGFPGLLLLPSLLSVQSCPRCDEAGPRLVRGRLVRAAAQRGEWVYPPRRKRTSSGRCGNRGCAVSVACWLDEAAVGHHHRWRQRVCRATSPFLVRGGGAQRLGGSSTPNRDGTPLKGSGCSSSTSWCPSVAVNPWFANGTCC